MVNGFIPHSCPTIRKDEMRHTLECMVSDKIAPGRLSKEFELKLAGYIGLPYVQAVSSGSMAFFLILKLLDVKEGDEIILPSYAPAVLLNPIYYLKAVPVLVDCSLGDYAPIKEQVAEKITEKTRALLLSHLFGLPIQLESYRELNIPIIENAAQSLGAEVDEKKCGSLGDYSFFSFYASKMISTGGTGGAVGLKKKEDYEKLKKIIYPDESHEFSLTYPFLMNDLQASMGISQLVHIGEFIQSREKIADFYTERLKEAGKAVPGVFLGRKRIFYRYVIASEIGIDESLSIFEKYKIETKRPISLPLHRYLKLENRDFPNSEKAFRENVSIPIYPTLKKSEAEAIAKIMTKI